MLRRCNIMQHVDVTAQNARQPFAGADPATAEHTAYGVAYRVRRSRRPSLSVRITPTGVEVRAPFWSSTSDIERLIYDRRDWIIKTSQATSARVRNWLHLVPGGQILWRGHPVPIALFLSKHDAAQFTDDACLIYSRTGCVPLDALEAELLRIARDTLPRRVRRMASLAGITVNEVAICEDSTAWGTCNLFKDVRLNRRLLLLPTELTDYVIAHELAHCIELNHSPRFWAQVARLDPLWRQRREELKRYSIMLTPFSVFAKAARPDGTKFGG